VRFAPLSLARLAVVAGVIGFAGQFVDNLVDEDRARSLWELLIHAGLGVLLGAVAVLLLLGWPLLAVTGYALQWGGMRLVRDPETVRLTAGLLTTRSTTVEEARIRGVELTEPGLMRLAGGAELATLATGVGDGTTQVLPPSPLAENERVAGLLLGDDAPVRVGLVAHGPRARRRLHLRRQALTVDVAVVTGIAVAYFDRPWWWAMAATLAMMLLNLLLAEAAYRNLGHTLTPRHLVSRHGTLSRVRTVLERDGVIGWVVSQSLFQRRAGLATLTATTAAGSERVTISDVPYATAVEVAAATTPTAVTPFLVGQP